MFIFYPFIHSSEKHDNFYKWQKGFNVFCTMKPKESPSQSLLILIILNLLPELYPFSITLLYFLENLCKYPELTHFYTASLLKYIIPLFL